MFRKADIDLLDPQSVVNTHPEVKCSNITIADIDRATSSARTSMQQGNPSQALRSLLSNPPYGCEESVKEHALEAVLSVLLSVRTNDIARVVESLSSQERFVLIKYLYKAMGTQKGQASGGTLLSWFESVSQNEPGAVLKHITDRRTV